MDVNKEIKEAQEDFNKNYNLGKSGIKYTITKQESKISPYFLITLNSGEIKEVCPINPGYYFTNNTLIENKNLCYLLLNGRGFMIRKNSEI